MITIKFLVPIDFDTVPIRELVEANGLQFAATEYFQTEGQWLTLRFSTPPTPEQKAALLADLRAWLIANLVTEDAQ